MNFIVQVKENYRFCIEVALLFSILLAISYLMGYWYTLNVNIFPFLTLSDLLTSAAYPLLLFVPIQLTQWLLVELHILPFLDNCTEKAIVKSKHVQKKWLLRAILFFLILIIAIIGWKLRISTLYFGVPVILLIGLAWVGNSKLKEHHEVHKNQWRVRALLMLGLFPFIAFDIGKLCADTILKGKEYSYALININNLSVPYKYLGFINGHYFFMDMNNKHLLVEKDEGKLVLEKYLKKKENDNNMISFT